MFMIRHRTSFQQPDTNGFAPDLYGHQSDPGEVARLPNINVFLPEG